VYYLVEIVDERMGSLACSGNTPFFSRKDNRKSQVGEKLLKLDTESISFQPKEFLGQFLTVQAFWVFTPISY
jgi:hypothetical protein